MVYAGKVVDLLPKVCQLAQELCKVGLQKVVLLPSTKTGKDVVIPPDVRIPIR